MRHLLFAFIALGCGTAQEKTAAPAPSDNGQTGSIGQSECSTDDDCATEAEHLLEPLRSPQENARGVTGGTCGPVAIEVEGEWHEGAACDCSVVGGGSLPLGPAGAPCVIQGRGGDCLWDTTDFPDCSQEAASFCDDACAELNDRLEADSARVFDVSVRRATCVEPKCEIVLRVEDRCYARTIDRVYDCSLSDDEILEQASSGG
jgi:hypothetical protein